MDLNKFATNKELEVEGIWHSLGDGRICIARANNPAFQRAMRKKATPHQMALSTGDEESDELLTRLTEEVMAETILVGFDNIEDEGLPLTYSVETSLMLLRKYPDFKELVSQKSLTARFYRQKTIGENAKK